MYVNQYLKVLQYRHTVGYWRLGVEERAPERVQPHLERDDNLRHQSARVSPRGVQGDS